MFEVFFAGGRGTQVINFHDPKSSSERLTKPKWSPSNMVSTINPVVLDQQCRKMKEKLVKGLKHQGTSALELPSHD